MNKIQYGSRDGLKTCPKECPKRSAECRLTCKSWKEHREKALKEYARRAKAGSSYIDSAKKQATIRKNIREKFKGH